ncbi:ImmA/IrrE family metallo-endopeptidase [Chlorogloea sp. CCALA 695]|uniref:ImmA/IrrE family metallo-endopeptidase n=1 Tax=Chlorogloea sp. CCALA 695 TaxID=2107693 RepID=UPI000D07CF72|nr:ImmA/IrrE family metallo-endopeptidase [Chlorogloea sp. CCALA 695]PSB34178.1 Zn peptidase [Chlorogloea sp. CCALA 695]
MGLITSLSTENRQRLEEVATTQRNQLSYKAFERLPASVLAQYFQATISTAETVPNAELEQVKSLCNSDNWSAVIIRKNPLWIVHNSRHAPTRQESNLMHELAHIILKHKMVGYDPKTNLPQRRQQDEDEAVYLGGCLQIPRRGLLWAVQKKMTIAQIALHFNASEEMVKFRTNVSGISLV